MLYELWIHPLLGNPFKKCILHFAILFFFLYLIYSVIHTIPITLAALFQISAVSQIESTVNRKPKSAPHQQWCSLFDC